LNGDGGLWKWVAAILVAIIMAGSPAVWLAATAPSREEVDLIRERQNTVLQRLAVIESRVDINQERLREILEQLELLRQELSRHTNGPVPSPQP
jgi:hypothetical protein